jgi:hypothetical protein
MNQLLLIILLLSTTCLHHLSHANLFPFNDDILHSSIRTGSSSSSSSTSSHKQRSTSTNNNPKPFTSSTSHRPIRVCYQGEPGAYSEKSLRELLGPHVIAVARPNFESCYQAVASRECDYACLPVENSLGGSIHEKSTVNNLSVHLLTIVL